MPAGESIQPNSIREGHKEVDAGFLQARKEHEESLTEEQILKFRKNTLMMQNARLADGVFKSFGTEPPDPGIVQAFATLLTEEQLRSISYFTEAERQYILARTDRLTGLPNRLALEERLQEIQTSGRHVGIFYIDIDNFKKINDTYGHAVGDQVLIEAAARLRLKVRQADIKLSMEAPDQRRLEEKSTEITDMVARLGGEEMVVIVEGVDTEEELQILGNRLLTAINGIPFTYQQTPQNSSSLPVTISVGAGVYRKGNIQELVNRIDKEGLYAAKNQGKNQVVIVPQDQ